MAIMSILQEQFRDVETVRIVNATMNIADCHDLGSGFVHDARGVRPYVPETLNGNRGITDVQLQMSDRLECHVDYSAPGGFFTPKTSSNREGFAGDDTRDSKANLLAVGIHDPGHDLRICTDVWSRHILFRTN